ncbi:MAG: ABC transporter permease subunit [Candidatus Dormibacteria bacterium]
MTLVIARLTIQEVVRRRLVLALLLLTGAAVALTGWGFSRLTGIHQQGRPISAAERVLITSQLLIFVFFMFSTVLGLGAVMVASPSISAEVESGQVLAVIARPISRLEMVVGKWAALCGLAVVYAAIASGLELLVVRVLTGYVPPHPIAMVAFVAAEGVVLVSLTLLLSVRLSGMTAGIVALVLFFMAWMGGIAGAVGTALGNAGVEAAGTVSRLALPTDGLWRGAIYNAEPESVLAVAAGTREAAANPFTATAAPAAAYLAWAAVWVIAVVALTAWSFRRREL